MKKQLLETVLNYFAFEILTLLWKLIDHHTFKFIAKQS